MITESPFQTLSFCDSVIQLNQWAEICTDMMPLKLLALRTPSWGINSSMAFAVFQDLHLTGTGLTGICNIFFVYKKYKTKCFLLNHNNVLLCSGVWASGGKKITKRPYITALWEEWDFYLHAGFPVIWSAFSCHALLCCLALGLIAWCQVPLSWIQKWSYIR